MKYGDYGAWETDKLMKRHQKRLSEIEAILMQTNEQKKLYELLECERELTLRETE